ncbi:uncharacterized protein PHACADRAFT_99731, partial [Phanerochaete carnosa HHB-10118-sp]
RDSTKQPIEDISGPVLDKSCKHICSKCHDSCLQERRIPHLALANGLWIGQVPLQLQGLLWTEQLLIAKVIRNYCVVRVSKSKMHKLRANAVCRAVSMPKILSVLPPKREELDDVLAFLYIGPTRPTPKDYKCTPFLIRYNYLNHCDYIDVEISKDNMAEYPENVPPVNVDYPEAQTTKNAESMAVNDNEEEDGTSEGNCPFTVHTLTSHQLTDLLNRDERGTIRNKASKHFKQGGKALIMSGLSRLLLEVIC